MSLTHFCEEWGCYNVPTTQLKTQLGPNSNISSLNYTCLWSLIHYAKMQRPVFCNTNSIPPPFSAVLKLKKLFCSEAKIWQSIISIPLDISSQGICVGSLLQYHNSSPLHHSPKCCCHNRAFGLYPEYYFLPEHECSFRYSSVACLCGNRTE